MRLAIVGFGRIGRVLFRINEQKNFFDIVAINDLNPDPKNLAYLLQYDSEYGRFPQTVEADDSSISINGRKVKVFNERKIEDIPWKDLDVDLVIDCSGSQRNVLNAHKVIKQGVSKVLITFSPDEVDNTIILGVNEDTYRYEDQNVISSSICDAVAVSPVIKIIDEAFGIESGFLTTMHPWLSYQNLLDGPSISWSVPGEIYHHYAVGRASSRAIIPKPTSAIEATTKVLPHLHGILKCMSFRVPISIVGAANLYLRLDEDVSLKQVREIFDRYEYGQEYPIIKGTSEPLVSIDFLGSEYSAIIDHRWTEISGPRHLYLVLWYDNEWGYANHALEVGKYILEQ